MAEIRHLESPEMAISQRKINWFWWNFVHNSKFETRRQSDDQILFFKFKMANGRHIKNRFFGRNSTADCPLSVKFAQASMAIEVTWQTLNLQNSRWLMAAILQIVNSPYQWKIIWFLMKFGTQQQIWNSITARWPNMNIFKIQDDGRPLF